MGPRDGGRSEEARGAAHGGEAASRDRPRLGLVPKDVGTDSFPGALAPGEVLSPAEDAALRAAFGRFARDHGHDGAGRAAGAAVVARHQRRGRGMWFACPCLGPAAPRPPVLVPVNGTHVRRHQDPPWPRHDPGCDFAREPGEQREILASYRKPDPLARVRLAGRFADAEAPERPRVESRSADRRRPALATLLCRLATDAGLQAVPAAGPPHPELREQVRALYAAAARVRLDATGAAPLSDWLCASPRGLPALLARVAAPGAGAAFPGSRPHGAMVALFAGAEGQALVRADGERVPVRGRVSLFGERADAPGRDTAEACRARAPYLAACLVARPVAGAAPEVLSAYLHPVAGPGWWLLLDSDAERRTLDRLLSVRSWLARRRGVGLAVERPLFDIAPAAPATAPRPDTPLPCALSAGAGEPPREPVLPDFVLRSADGAALAAAETMGRDGDPEYLSRKARTHALASAALGGAPVLLHRFGGPAGESQADRDDEFWRDATRAALGGAGHPGRSRRARAPDRGAAAPGVS